MKDDRVYLEHILECLDRVEKHRRLGRRRFFNSHTIQDAVLHNLQTMAESTQRLSDILKSTQPNIPWEDISGFRNVLVHNYLGIDLEVIWGIMLREAPELKIVIQTMLRGLSNDHTHESSP
jgi:uncharacterized protein with HEPN domain